MHRLLSAALLVLTTFATARAQRDFLTEAEIERIREAQEPNARLKLYIGFAKQRIDQLDQLLKKDRKGRTLDARQLLEDYTQIIDAIDSVSDDALQHHVNLTEGLNAVTQGERRFLGQLEKIQANPPGDAEMFDFALREAIAGTKDSVELADKDVGRRSEELGQRVEREKQAVAESSTTQQVKEQEKEDSKAAKPAGGRKPPTLLKPGEKVGDPDNPPPAKPKDR